MHELGIVFAMIDQLEDVAKEQHLAHIQKVTVDLGEVSGIVTDFFEDAWTWAANKNKLTEGAELEVCTVPAVTVCNTCGKTYGTVEHAASVPTATVKTRNFFAGANSRLFRLKRNNGNLHER